MRADPLGTGLLHGAERSGTAYHMGPTTPLGAGSVLFTLGALEGGSPDP